MVLVHVGSIFCGVFVVSPGKSCAARFPPGLKSRGVVTGGVFVPSAKRAGGGLFEGFWGSF